MRVSSGCLVAFTQHVEFDVQTLPGFKNVMFGGEGLFVTTLTGPGTIWLQGMPPDRMISEIARRVPSGGGIGLGIPVGMGGGEGSGSVGDSEAGEGADETNPSDIESSTDEDLVASTDAQVEMDRNATIASSGFEQSDAESASSLFGDAAPKDEPSYGSSIDSSNATSSPDNSIFDDDPPNKLSEMDDSTSFSTDNSGFTEDFNNEQQFGNFEQDDTSFSTEAGADDGGLSGDSEESTDIFGMIWDFLRDDD